jgi:tellurite resistance protein TerC
MNDLHLFPIGEYAWMLGIFLAIVAVILVIDLGVFHRKAHAVTVREAAAWTTVWVLFALGVGVGLYFYSLWWFPQDPRLMAIEGFDPAKAARQVGLEFLAGYVVEESLSVDNIFVFVVIFSYFRIPPKFQHRILFYGIVGALLFRAIFISLGTLLMAYHWVVFVFGAFLILTGVKLLLASEHGFEPEHNPVLKLVRRLFPIAPVMDNRFFLRINGVLHATPLFVTLVLIEFTDIIFAVDSVPAIFALTKEPLIVFTSNICAILGLRSMYFLFAGAVDKFHLLRYGLALVLMFVGLKMVWLNDAFDGKFPISWSLGIIVLLIGGSLVASLLFPQKAAEHPLTVPPAAPEAEAMGASHNSADETSGAH